MYGPHLIVDGYGASKSLLSSVSYIYGVLDAMPGKIGMTKIMPPHVQQYSEKSNDEWGISGFVIIAESHIAVHTYPNKGFLVMDIFSCKDFDIDAARDHIKEVFKIKRMDHRLLGRGADYPKDIEKAARVATRDRFAVPTRRTMATVQ